MSARPTAWIAASFHRSSKQRRPGSARPRCSGQTTLRFTRALAFALCLLGATLGSAHARPIEGDPDAAPRSGEILLRFEPGVTAARIANLQRDAGARLIRTIPGIDVHLLAVDDVARSLALYRAADELRWAEPNGKVWLMGEEPSRAQVQFQTQTQTQAQIQNRAPLAPSDRTSAARAAYAPRQAHAPDKLHALDARPNDPRFAEQWHHETIGSEAGWEFSRAHETVIAIIDTGVECDHPDLAGACVEGYDFVNRDDDPADDHHHGTIEAGMAAAITDNGIGVAGLAWGAKIMPLKAMPGQGGGSFADIAEAIVWAADHGADVANMSLGASSSSKAIEDAVAHGVEAGMTMVASAGNHGTGDPSYPAGLPDVIGVGASKPDDTRASFSAYGDHVSVAAPGWQVLSTDWTEEYEEYGIYDGTSEAAPLVAGLAALLIDQAPSRSPAWVRHRIEDTAKDVGIAGRDPEFGWGRIDVARALDPTDPGNGVAPTPDEPVAPTFTPSPTDTPSPTEAPSPAYLPQLRLQH